VSTATIAGRYELGPRLGVGGMSTVMLGRDHRLERDVAVKLLAEHLADDSQFVTRFRREALNAARLVHPNIVQVFDFGFDEDTGRHFIVMEYVRGRSGAELLRDEGRLPVSAALAIVTQSCRGLDYAHRNGVVHRDVKPGNLLRAEDGTVKLADFGIAKALSEESSITQAGSVLGTAAYLAPEQAHGEPAGPPADLYALGVVTYQFLAGRLPYEAQSLTELAFKQQQEVPPSLDLINGEVTPQLGAAVQRAMALDPRDRYASAEEMRVALVDGVRGVAPTTAVTRMADAATAATTVHAGEREPTATTRASRSVEPRRAREPRSARQAAAAAPATPAPAPARDRGRRAQQPARGRGPTGRPRRRHRVRRFFGVVFLLLLFAAGGAAAIIATSNDSDAVHLRQVVYDNVNQSVDALKQLVQDNTQ